MIVPGAGTGRRFPGRNDPRHGADRLLYSATMLRRWWRRRPNREPEPDLPPGAAEEDRGESATAGAELVRAGELVDLRRHVPANRDAFQRWYADPEIAELLRHDQEPLNEIQSRSYFETFILPLSARGMCWAIHEHASGRLLGTTAITDVTSRRGAGRSALFRIVIGEKDAWGRGYGTEATKLVMEESFDELDLDEVRLEVFRHNPRAIAAYRRVGFEVTGEHVEWVGRRRVELHVVEMALSADAFWDLHDDDEDDDEDWDDDDSADWDDEDDDEDEDDDDLDEADSEPGRA